MSSTTGFNLPGFEINNSTGTGDELLATTTGVRYGGVKLVTTVTDSGNDTSTNLRKGLLLGHAAQGDAYTNFDSSQHILSDTVVLANDVFSVTSGQLHVKVIAAGRFKRNRLIDQQGNAYDANGVPTANGLAWMAQRLDVAPEFS